MAYSNGRPMTALPLDTFTTAPPAPAPPAEIFVDMRRSASLVQSIGPATFTAKMALRSSRLACSTDLHPLGPVRTPALLTSPATTPSTASAQSSIAANMATTSSSTPTSAGKAAATPPASTMDATTPSAASFDPVRWFTATAQPSRARSRQHAAPIPFAPPVTTAIFLRAASSDGAAARGTTTAPRAAFRRSDASADDMRRYAPGAASACFEATATDSMTMSLPNLVWGRPFRGRKASTCVKMRRARWPVARR